MGISNVPEMWISNGHCSAFVSIVNNLVKIVPITYNVTIIRSVSRSFATSTVVIIIYSER